MKRFSIALASVLFACSSSTNTPAVPADQDAAACTAVQMYEYDSAANCLKALADVPGSCLRVTSGTSTSSSPVCALPPNGRAYVGTLPSNQGVSGAGWTVQYGTFDRDLCVRATCAPLCAGGQGPIGCYEIPDAGADAQR